MTINEVISERQKKRGIPVSKLAERTGIDYEALRVSLKGNRKISAYEFVALCKELELTLADFDSAELSEGLC